EPGRMRPGRGGNQVPDPDQRGQDAPDLHNEHHGVPDHRPRIELAEAVEEGGLQETALPGGDGADAAIAHAQNTLPEAARTCSTIGPRLSTGKNVRAPTIRITPTTRAANSGPVVGSVPGPGATAFLPARNPAIASTGTIITNRPASITTPSVT